MCFYKATSPPRTTTSSSSGRGGVWAKIPQYHRDSFQRALRKGVKIAFGTDAGGFAGNPLNDITAMERVGFVMKDGQAYKKP